VRASNTIAFTTGADAARGSDFFSRRSANMFDDAFTVRRGEVK
jgi:hypothetical protein